MKIKSKIVNIGSKVESQFLSSWASKHLKNVKNERGRIKCQVGETRFVEKRNKD